MNHPVDRFRSSSERAGASETIDATAASLATVDPKGRPSVRTVLVKWVDEEGFRFFTNYNSPKARDLATNPEAALLFFWPHIGEQVRIVGPSERLSAEDSDQYWESRPRQSQLGAWASDQSAELESREALLARLSSVETQYADQTVPRPPHWGGFILRPRQIEFWINGEHRLHDRFLYRATGDRWTKIRLNP